MLRVGLALVSVIEAPSVLPALSPEPYIWRTRSGKENVDADFNGRREQDYRQDDRRRIFMRIKRTRTCGPWIHLDT